MEYEEENPDMGLPLPSAPALPISKKLRTKTPQDSIDEFWACFTSKFPGKPQRILPANAYATTKAAKSPKGVVHGQAALKSYDQAALECIAAVEKIAKECRRVNMKYRDPHFDIEFDLKRAGPGPRDCLDGLFGRNGDSALPKSVKRVPVSHLQLGFVVNFITKSYGAAGYLRRACILPRRCHGKRCTSRPKRRLLVSFCTVCAWK